MGHVSLLASLCLKHEHVGIGLATIFTNKACSRTHNYKTHFRDSFDTLPKQRKLRQSVPEVRAASRSCLIHHTHGLHDAAFGVTCLSSRAVLSLDS